MAKNPEETLRAIIDGGNVDQLRQMVEANPSILQDQIDGMSPLMYALHQRKLLIANFLAEADSAALLVPDSNGSLPLHWFVQDDTFENVKSVIHRIADTFGENMVQAQLLHPNAWNRVPLWYAVRCGDSNMVKYLFDRCPAGIKIIPMKIEIADSEVKIISPVGPSIPRFLADRGIYDNSVRAMQILNRTREIFGFEWMPTSDVTKIQFYFGSYGNIEMLAPLLDAMRESEWRQNYLPLIENAISRSKLAMVQYLVRRGYQKYGIEWFGSLFGPTEYECSILIRDMSLEMFEYLAMECWTGLESTAISISTKTQIRADLIQDGPKLLRRGFRMHSYVRTMEARIRFLASIGTWDPAGERTDVRGIDVVVTSLNAIDSRGRTVMDFILDYSTLQYLIPEVSFLAWLGAKPNSYPMGRHPEVYKFLDALGLGPNSISSTSIPEDEILAIRGEAFFERSLTAKLCYFV